MNNVEERVKKVIAEQRRLGVSEVSNDASFVDLGADSLDKVEIVMALGDEFDLEITEAETESITTVQQAVECVVNHQSR
jgi:acyl carrier protein